jgi:hypothetical protein
MMKDLKVKLEAFQNSEMYGGRQSASRSGHFTLEKRAVDDDDDVDF